MSLGEGHIINSLGEEVEAKKLRVHRVLNDSLDPLTSDFTILGFRKESPSYFRGRKTKAIYKCTTTEDIIVEKIFNDIIDSEGLLSGIEVKFNWYYEDNSIGLEKTEVVKRYNKYEAETEERKRRYRQFDYLRASVKHTPYESYIAALIGYFQSDIDAYKNDGIMDLNQKMIDVSNIDLSTVEEPQRHVVGQIQGILNAQIARNDGQGATTVLKSIQYQIGTITIEEL